MPVLRTKNDTGTPDTRWDQGNTVPPDGNEVPVTTSRIVLTFTPVDANGDKVAHATAPTADVRVISYRDGTPVQVSTTNVESGWDLSVDLVADDMTPGGTFTVWMGAVTGLDGSVTGVQISWEPLRP